MTWIKIKTTAAATAAWLAVASVPIVAAIVAAGSVDITDPQGRDVKIERHEFSGTPVRYVEPRTDKGMVAKASVLNQCASTFTTATPLRGRSAPRVCHPFLGDEFRAGSKSADG